MDARAQECERDIDRDLDLIELWVGFVRDLEKPPLTYETSAELEKAALPAVTPASA